MSKKESNEDFWSLDYWISSGLIYVYLALLFTLIFDK